MGKTHRVNPGVFVGQQSRTAPLGSRAAGSSDTAVHCHLSLEAAALGSKMGNVTAVTPNPDQRLVI